MPRLCGWCCMLVTVNVAKCNSRPRARSPAPCRGVAMAARAPRWLANAPTVPATFIVCIFGVLLSLAAPPAAALAAASRPATVALFHDTSNIPADDDYYGLGSKWPPRPAYGATVHELGNFSGVDQCKAACLAFEFRCRMQAQGTCEDPVSPVSGWSKCQSFSFFPSGRCVAVVAADEWFPFAARGITSGQVDWPPQRCSSRGDCSHNGECNPDSRLCVCTAAWTGDRCQTLALQPASRNAGLRSVDDGANTSSWGGQALWDDESEMFHMWSSEIQNQ